MELEEIRRQSVAAREFEWTCGHASFWLRVPTRYEIAIAARRAEGEDVAHLLVLERALLEKSIVRWNGVKLRDILPDGDESAVEFDASLVPLLLDAQGDWWRDLAVALFDRMAQRKEAQDTAAKN